jgi:DNA-binding NarL/FixJ family response regulator
MGDCSNCAGATIYEEGGVSLGGGSSAPSIVAVDLRLIWRRHQQLASARIVVVDDFEAWRRSIISILSEDPALEIIHEASDGLEAVQICWELQPDLVVLDVGLPKLNGFEAARRIREVSPGTKILFLSATPSRDLLREALRIGAVGYISKVDALRDLLPAVRAVLLNEEFLRFTILPETEELPED